MPVSASGYGSIAVTTLLLCDFMDSLSTEVTYVWFYHRKANWTTLFYLITRYLPFALVALSCISFFLIHNNIISPSLSSLVPVSDWQFLNPTPIQTLNLDGTHILYIIPWFVILVFTEILFIKRTVALYVSGSSYHSSTFLTRILACLFLCEMTVAIVSFIILFGVDPLASNSDEIIDGYLSTYGLTFGWVYQLISIPNGLSNLFFVLPEIVFQAILVSLVLKKAFSDWIFDVPGDLAITLTRDGLWSYFSNLCGLLIAVIQPPWLTGTSGLPIILWSSVSFSIASTRLILNIRAAAAKQLGVNDSVPSADTRLTFVQGVRSFLASGTDELSVPYHYSDFGHDADDDEAVHQ